MLFNPFTAQSWLLITREKMILKTLWEKEKMHTFFHFFKHKFHHWVLLHLYCVQYQTSPCVIIDPWNALRTITFKTFRYTIPWQIANSFSSGWPGLKHFAYVSSLLYTSRSSNRNAWLEFEMRSIVYLKFKYFPNKPWAHAYKAWVHAQVSLCSNLKV